MRSPCAVVVAAVMAVPIPVVGFDNLVSNGSFDTDLSGWSQVWGQVAWSPESTGAGASGSARLTGIHPFGGTADTPLWQCVPLGEGRYLLRAAIRVPVGQSRTGHGYVLAYAYGDDGCGGGPVAGAFSTTPITASEWTRGATVVAVPPSGASVSVRASVVKHEDGGTFDLLLDDVELIPGYLHHDGFDLGDTSAWSSVVP